MELEYFLETALRRLWSFPLPDFGLFFFFVFGQHSASVCLLFNHLQHDSLDPSFLSILRYLEVHELETRSATLLPQERKLFLFAGVRIRVEDIPFFASGASLEVLIVFRSPNGDCKSFDSWRITGLHTHYCTPKRLGHTKVGHLGGGYYDYDELLLGWLYFEIYCVLV